MASEHGFLLFTITFLSMFFLVVALIPPVFFIASTSTYEPASSMLETFVLEKGDDYICDNVTIPVGALNYYLNVVWVSATNHIGYGFGTFYPFIVFWLAPIIDRDYLVANQIDGKLILTLTDVNNTVYVTSIITYDATLYDSLTEAFDDGSVLVYIGGLTSSSSPFSSVGLTSGLGLIAQLLFFSSPDIDPVLNAIIAIPIWAAIAISIIIIWSMIKPF